MAKYKKENGNYYRLSSDGNWFQVLNEDGYFTWTLPNGLKMRALVTLKDGKTIIGKDEPINETKPVDKTEEISVAENAWNKLTSAANAFNPVEILSDVYDYTKNYFSDTKPIAPGLRTQVPNDNKGNFFTGLWKDVGGKLLNRIFNGLSFLNFLSPSQWYRTAEDAEKNGFSFRRMGNSILNGNSGFFSPKYAEEHPIISMIGNGVGDAIVPSAAFLKTPKLIKTPKSLVTSSLSNKGVVNQLITFKSSDIDWFGSSKKNSYGLLELPDGSLFDPANDKVLDRYLGKPSERWDMGIIQGHEDQGSFDLYRYSQNGRDYYIGTANDSKKVAYATPGEDFKFIDVDYDRWDDAIDRAMNKATKSILDSRHNFIESLPDEDIKTLVRSSNVNTKIPNDPTNDDLFSIIGNPLDYIIKNSVKKDIEDIYLSDAYIDRYMRLKGLNPKNQEFREQIRSRLAKDILHTYNNADPILYRLEPEYGGISASNIPDSKHVYGINTNAAEDFLKNDWTSSIFHEFGHNLWDDNTPFSKYLKKYNTRLIHDNYNPYTDLIIKNVLLHPDSYNYISEPTEFRQRIMEGVRYGIKNNLTPEQIYEQCQVPGFFDLKLFFKKDYIIKMLGLMLGTTPVIINTNNDKTS